jgi:hypothetical protein
VDSINDQNLHAKYFLRISIIVVLAQRRKEKNGTAFAGILNMTSLTARPPLLTAINEQSHAA